MALQQDQEVFEEEFEIATSTKPVKSIFSYQGKKIEDFVPALVFTHGAGGTLRSDAMANFICGFTDHSPILCFQGNMNLNSRVKMFAAVCEQNGTFKALGGRSMGARAAVMSRTDETAHLVLCSYPLHTDTQTRDQILLELPSTIKVLFIIGQKDSMCDIARLNAVRSKMNCDTWLITVGPHVDHGMNVKPKSGTRKVGILTGRIAAEWLENPIPEAREGSITWDGEAHEAHWGGWKNLKTATTGKHQREPKDPSDATSHARSPRTSRTRRKRDIETSAKVTSMTKRRKQTAA